MITAAENSLRSSNSDHSFFSKSKHAPATSTTAVVITTRVISNLKPVAPPHQQESKKRKAEGVEAPVIVVKRSRSRSPPPQVVRDPLRRSRSGATASVTSSRHSSRVKRSVSPDAGYRNSRSRSVTAFNQDTSVSRECWISEDGTPGPGCLGCEAVVCGLMKGYKACTLSRTFFHVWVI